MQTNPKFNITQMADSKICSSCGSDLREGFLYVRNDEKANLFNYIVWVEGKKEDIISKFMGVGTTAPQYPLRIYKCSNCGHIDFFADPDEKWKY